MPIQILNTAMKHISDMKLKRKLLLSYFLLIVIPFGMFTFFFDHRVSHETESLVKFSMKQSFEQSGDFISYKLKKIMDALNVILVDKKVNGVLARDPDAVDIHTQIRDMNELSTYLKSFQNNDEIYNIKLYVNDNLIYSTEMVNFLSLTDARNASWYNRLNPKQEKVLWIPLKQEEGPATYDNTTMLDTGKKISAIRAILDSNDYAHMIGLLRIDVLENNLNEIIRKTSSTQNGVTYIQNSRNEIISSSTDQIKSEWIFGNDRLDGYAKNGTFFDVQRIKGESVLFACQKIPNSDWTLVSITPYSEIVSVGEKIKNDMLLLFLAIGTVAYGIAYIISFSITKRIGLLIGKMRNMKGGGGFNTEIVSTSQDEIGELIDNFNDMSKKLGFHIKEQFRIGQEAKQFELLALQAQINPHFLYNTLDLINWTAINNNVPEIAETVESLSKFYKLSLSKGTNIIPIRDEIEHVKMYMDIQNRRYENAFDLVLDIGEEVYQYTIIKIILQPIIENSIIHGILHKVEKSGTITVTGRIEEDNVILAVRDDGIGMPEESVENIFSISKEKSSHGYGIRNINERIRLYYGEQYGLYYKSTPGQGTEVSVVIPCRRLTSN